MTSEKTRTRTCTDPAPGNGGSDCVDLPDDEYSQPCGSEMRTSPWSSWSTCTQYALNRAPVSRDNFIQSRIRTCVGDDCDTIRLTESTNCAIAAHVNIYVPRGEFGFLFGRAI